MKGGTSSPSTGNCSVRICRGMIGFPPVYLAELLQGNWL